MKKNLLHTMASTGALLAPMSVMAQFSPTPAFTGHLGKTVQETRTAYPQRNPQAPKGAPNVIWILIDDLGFGGTSAFGGLIETPTFDYLANNGLRFNNFHTTSISAPTRSALLTGRNHHSSHVGMFNTDTYGTPGYDTYIPMENGNIAEVLRENGYNTFAIGKYNATPANDGKATGPYNRWPTNRGFDHFFGYHPVTACDDQWHPIIYRDTQREPDDSLGQLAITRFADRAINFIADEKTADPEKPFFLYFAPGTAHWPHHTTKEWINKYKGKFDAGWDEYAKQTLENQIKLGVVPKGTKLPIQNKTLEKWNDQSPLAKKVFARQMEVYAGFVSHADYEIGRIVDYLREIHQLDNTLIIVSLGDNGSAGVGGKTSLRSNSRPKTAAEKDAILQHINKEYDNLGDESSYPFYPEGWAAATGTPFRYYKAFADYEGGTHNGLIVFYPNGITDKGGIRTQYTHVIDVLPTTVELTGSKVPEVINGYKQNPIEGTSFAYAVKAADNNIEDQKHVQYYELSGSHAIYKDGWKAQFPKDNWMFQRRYGEIDSIPHLYHIAEDFNESKDLAKKYPEKLKELENVFEEEAWKYNVYPFKPGDFEVVDNPITKSKSTKKHFDILFGTRNYTEVPYISGYGARKYTLTSEIDVKQPSDANGTLYATANLGYYLKDGVPSLVYKDEMDTIYVKVTASQPVKIGKNKLQLQVNYDHSIKSTNIKFIINETVVTEKNIKKRILGIPGSNSVLQVGRTWGYALDPDYKSPNVLKAKYLSASVDFD